ncbi:hypothetical protein EJ08DRAFT_698031 [Tothia fuscella]|uniref:Uncharacterized protein n=1 Tax=Tothia fuscella TaxID=1048955 RepID=A0A9P4NR33_9PEZI|nr:hypothetical protein EJ08DRAFT_698031 [Tothia fuscella]
MSQSTFFADYIKNCSVTEEILIYPHDGYSSLVAFRAVIDYLYFMDYFDDPDARFVYQPNDESDSFGLARRSEHKPSMLLTAQAYLDAVDCGVEILKGTAIKKFDFAAKHHWDTNEFMGYVELVYKMKFNRRTQEVQNENVHLLPNTREKRLHFTLISWALVHLQEASNHSAIAREEDSLGDFKKRWIKD